MMKVLFLWHAAADPNNRSVLEEAISHPGLDILVLATPVLEDRLSEWSLRHPITKHCHRSGSRLRIIPAATFMPKSPGYHFHPSLPLHIIRFRPDLIHVHEEAASLAAVESSVWRAILAPRARLIIHPYQNIRVDYRWPWPPLERFVLECANAAVAGNPGAARVLAGRGFRKPVFLLRTLGAYARDFSMQRRGPVRRTMKSGVPVIGFSGRIFSGKGLHILFQAASRMKKKAQFLVVGDGPRMEAARSQVEGLGLAGRVHFAGSIPAKKMADYYSAMDIFAAPTIDRPADMPDWKEQCPRAHVEAMLSGLAMVASDGGENRWTIGNAGIIVPRANPSALAGALDRLCANSRLRRSLGKKARSRAVANFTWEKAAQGLVKIWRKLPEKRG